MRRFDPAGEMEDLQPRAAYLDPARGAWVLSRYADVTVALRHPRLSMAGTEVEPHVAQRPLQDAAARELSPARLAAWRAAIEPAAHDLLGTLPTEQPVDLVRAFAEPWSLFLALQVTGVSAADATDLLGWARELFLAAACATGPEVLPGTQAAAAELARRLQGAGSSLGVQSFVALSQTLPCLLAAAWRELFHHPEQLECLRAEPGRIPGAVEELMRHASPARAVFRRARSQIRIGGAGIDAGESVILMLAAANHDPARFPEPECLDFERHTTAHLAFGGGPHACAGARLIRMAVIVATEALLRTTDAVEVLGPVEWIGGFAIRAPASLRVVLHRQPGGRNVLCASGSSGR